MKLTYAASLAATFVALSLSLQTPAPLPPEAAEAPQTRPNIVVIVTDDQDYDSMPAMRKLLSYPRGSWINFTNAFAADSLCAPSRATMLSGQYPTHHGVTYNEYNRRFNAGQALPVWLDDAGYQTAIIGKYHLGNSWRHPAPGWDVWNTRNYPNDIDKHSQLAVEFIQANNTPFFLWLSYMAPHAKAKPPERYKNADVYLPPVRPNVNEADVSDKPGFIRNRHLLSPHTLLKWRNEQLNAQREILAIDDGVAAVIEELAATGQLNNTLVIFISDNGMSWGSHRKIGKWCPYEECSHIALLIRYPGAQGNRTETRMVSNVDITPTITQYAGVTPTIPQDGRSLMPLLTNSATSWRNSVLLERHVNDDYYGIRVPGWKYIEYHTGFRELYDLTNDPYEMQNVANQPQYAATQANLAQQLQAIKP